jgi:cytochrome P450
MPATTLKEVTAPANAVETVVPTGVQLTPFDEAFRDNPYPVLERLRNAEPVHRDEALSRWFITGFDDVREVLKNKELSVNIQGADPGSYAGRIATNASATGLTSTLNSMLFMDDPAHRRVRSIANKPFSPRAIEEMRPRIRSNIAELLDKMTSSRFDLVTSFAGPLPVIVIADILGIDQDKRAAFKTWSEDLIGGFFNPLKIPERNVRGARAQQDLNDYLTGVVETRRKQPGTDLISSLITTEEDGEHLTDAEILSTCNLILIAGNVTTSDLIANAVKTLLEHPSQLAALRAEPELIVNTVEEVLRYDSPTTQAQRILPVDTSLHGCPMHKGQSITVSLASANRDPRANPQPDRFDIRRKDIKHQSFGGGKHLCLGNSLARAEAQEAILGLIHRFPNLSLLEQKFEYRPVPSFRALKELWVSRD